jgi:hypothetical protein
VTIPELIEQLTLILTKNCSPRDVESNFSNLVNIFNEYFNNIVNVVHLKAWAILNEDLCPIDLDTVLIKDFEPWYDPADFPDIPTPTSARNRKALQVPDQTLIEIEYNRADNVWEWVDSLHSQYAVGTALTYGSHSLILSRSAINVPIVCPAGGTAVSFTEVIVQKTNLFSGLVGETECELGQLRTAIWLPEEDIELEPETVISFDFQPVLNDVYHLPGDGIYVYEIMIWTPCFADIGPRKVVDTGPCVTSGGSGA